MADQDDLQAPQQETRAVKPSAIRGEGWGADHKWRRGETVYRRTFYSCDVCGEHFWHNYPRIASIFAAMHDCGISEHCKSTTA